MLWFAGILIIYCLTCIVLARSYVMPARRTSPTPAGWEDRQLPGYDRPIPTLLSPMLSAGKASGKPLFILAHGYGGSRAGWEELARELTARDANVMIPAMRGQDASLSDKVGFGLLEGKELAALTHWARTQVGSTSPIVLVGISMGGAACWLASPEADVDAIATEGAYARLDEAVDRWMSMLVPGGTVLLWPMRALGSKFAGVNESQVNPVDAAAKWNGKPALVIHCSEDRLMDRTHAERLAAASGAELWVINGAEHAQGSTIALRAYADHLLLLASKAGKRLVH